jgi:hypothetical protein
LCRSLNAIFNLDNFAALVNALTTTKDFANAGWTVTTTSYTATGIKVPFVHLHKIGLF